MRTEATIGQTLEKLERYAATLINYGQIAQRFVRDEIDPTPENIARLRAHVREARAALEGLELMAACLHAQHLTQATPEDRAP